MFGVQVQVFVYSERNVSLKCGKHSVMQNFRVVYILILHANMIMSIVFLPTKFTKCMYIAGND